MHRNSTPRVMIGDPSTGGVVMMGGGLAPVVQTMTSVDTANVDASVKQISELAKAGAELVRIAVDRPESAAAVPYIYERLRSLGVDVPLIGDFHYNGHSLLADNEDCAQLLDKYRINPGNIGFGEKRDARLETIVGMAIERGKAIRIGVNWGSLDQDLLSGMMDENAKKTEPQSAEKVLQDAVVKSAILSANRAVEIGLPPEKLVISAKASRVGDVVSIYRSLSMQTNYCLHLGLTEAGAGRQGTIASTAALAPLLLDGIGDTIRVSVTPGPDGDRREEVMIAKDVLQSLGLRYYAPSVTACPGCGRTSSDRFRHLANEVREAIDARLEAWRERHPDVVKLKVAVMGCIVNGPGESRHADIGISLPGNGEANVAPVFIDGKKAVTLRGENISKQFIELIDRYVEEKFL